MTTVGVSVARRWKRDEAITLDAKHRDASIATRHVFEPAVRA